MYWIREAWNDLAKLLYKASKRNASAFHSHQAVEKALKALWIVVLRREPVRSRVSTELYAELKKLA